MVVPQPTVLCTSTRQLQDFVLSREVKICSNGYISHTPDKANYSLPSAMSSCFGNDSEMTLLLSRFLQSTPIDLVLDMYMNHDSSYGSLKKRAFQ